MSNAIAAVDLGGTQLRCAVVIDGRIRHRKVVETSAGSTEPWELLRRIKDLVLDAGEEAGVPFNGVGIAVPGPTDWGEGIIYKLPNVPGWEKPVHVLDMLEGLFPGLPVVVENDANAATWAEYLLGAGVGLQNFVYITVSSGVGAGFIVNGELLRGANGLGGELGHLTVMMDGPTCGCGQRGHLEALASGTAIARMAREIGHDISAKEVDYAARHGESWAVEVLARAGRALGFGLANVANLFNPELIAIGGGVCQAGELVLHPATRVLHNNAMPLVCETPVKLAELADDPGLVGVALLVEDELSK